MATIEEQEAAQLYLDNYQDVGPQLPAPEDQVFTDDPIADTDFNYVDPNQVDPSGINPGFAPISDDQALGMIQAPLPVEDTGQSRFQAAGGFENEIEPFQGPQQAGVAPEVVAPEIITEEAPAVTAQKEIAADALNKLTGLQRQEASINEQLGKEEYEVLEGFRKRKAEIDVENELEIEADQQKVHEANEELEQANEDLGELKIDRDRWWGSRSTGQKIAAALSLMITGYQSGAAGKGISPLVGMINKAIDKDVADQVASYRGKERGVQRKQTLLDHYKGKLGDTEKAVAALKTKAYDDAIAKVQLSVAKQKGPLAKLKGEQAIAQLEVQRDIEKAKYLKVSLKDQIALSKESREQKKITTSIKRGGKFLTTNRPTEATKANEIYADLNTAQKSIGRLNQLYDQYDITDLANPNSDVKIEMESIRVGLKAAFRKYLVGGGTLSEADQAVIDLAIKDPNGFYDTIATNRGRKSYNNLLKNFEVKSNEQLKTLVPGYTSKSVAMDMQPGAI